MSELVEKKTIGEVERIVHGSGMWDGTGPVEFSNDGETWSETWAPSTEHPLPEFARVEVYRKDVRIPTKVTIRWDEQVPRADEFWAAKWLGAPMRHFGRTARMVCYRQTFRDLLGDIVIEDEGDDRAEQQPAPAAPVERDWLAEIAEAQSIELFTAIEKDARAARIFTATPEGTALHIAFRARRRELTTPDVDPWAAPEAEPADEERAPKPGAPRDFLPPANRAARRKAARKKGGKR